MPRTAINYSKTIIYKIVCNDLTITDLYVGSTTNFTNRKNGHKIRCNGNTEKAEYKIYKIIRDNGGWDNWAMIQIEEFPCENSNESRARERYWIEELNAKLNVVIPTRTREEYRESHKEESKEYKKINKEKLALDKKEWDKKNKDEINRKRKEYIDKNRDRINRVRREWREKKKLALSLKDDQV